MLVDIFSLPHPLPFTLPSISQAPQLRASVFPSLRDICLNKRTEKQKRGPFVLQDFSNTLYSVPGHLIHSYMRDFSISQFMPLYSER